MPTNDFIGFASSGSANIASQADYAAAAEQGIGMQPGPASSKLANKVWRQGANMAAALGRIAAARGYDALDNGDLNALQSSLDDTISVGTFNRMYFSQTSGSYTAPRTGVYRITLKSGGGSGGWHGTSGKVGGAGGEGGEMIFYKVLTKNTSYSYAIGAGGAAPSAAGDEGAVGGATSFNSGEYSIDGGGRGRNPTSTAYAGGQGGYNAVVPAGTAVYVRPGQSGEPGGTKDTYSLGGGCAPNNGGVARLGAGGRGGGPDTSAGTAGADGFILIEYAG